MWKIKEIFIVWILLTLPVLAFGGAYSSVSKNFTLTDEEPDGGRTNITSASGNYSLKDACDPVYNQGTTSTAHTINQGTYFNIYRDLLPPYPVTFLNSSVRPDHNVVLTWNAVADQENQVWGYRIYRSYYYGPDKFETRIVDAPQNTVTVYADVYDQLYGIQYFYEIRAVDGALNEQSAGNKILSFAPVKQANSVIDLTAVSKAGGLRQVAVRIARAISQRLPAASRPHPRYTRHLPDDTDPESQGRFQQLRALLDGLYRP